MAFTFLAADGGAVGDIAGRAGPLRRGARPSARAPTSAACSIELPRGRRRGARASARTRRRADRARPIAIPDGLEGSRHRPRDRRRRSPTIIAERQDGPVERPDGRVRAGAVRGRHPRRRAGGRRRAARSRVVGGGDSAARRPRDRAGRRVRPRLDRRRRLARVPRGATAPRHHAPGGRSDDRTSPDHRGELEDAQDPPGGDPGRPEALATCSTRTTPSGSRS